MKIAAQKVASLGYTLKDDDGQTIDKADASHPFLYLHGAGGVIKGLESALENKEANDSFSVTIAPEDAYGDRNDALVESVPRAMFEGIENDQLVAGAQFHAQTAQGTQVIKIVSVDSDTVNIDANHPLAGQTLHFDVEVLEVRDATEEEITHGHPHTPGGCCGSDSDEGGSCCSEDEPKEEEKPKDSCCGGNCGG